MVLAGCAATSSGSDEGPGSAGEDGVSAVDVVADLTADTSQNETAESDAGIEPRSDVVVVSDTSRGPELDALEEPVDGDAGTDPTPDDAAVSDVAMTDVSAEDIGAADAGSEDASLEPFEPTLEICGGQECPTELEACVADEVCGEFLACVSACEEENTPVCGDGECEGMMEQFMCSEDCGESDGMPGGDGGDGGWEMPECGDGECGWGETFEECPEDCAEPECGDAQCNGDETEETCTEDCDGSDDGGMGDMGDMGDMEDMMPKVVADCVVTCSETLGIAPQSFDALFFCAEEADCMNPMADMMGGGGMPFP
jgi:hypothetical protein